MPDDAPDLALSEARDAWPIHNDWAHYRTDGYPRSLIWSAITVDDCPSAAGPIHVWPGSHVRHPEHEEHGGALRVSPTEVDASGGTDLDAPAGSVLLFHSLLLHNSAPNRTDDPRRLLLFAHYPEHEFDAYFDRRNGPTRYEESSWEAEYHRRKWAGEYTDQFSLGE